MRQAMAADEVGDDMFGKDPTVSKLESRVADFPDKETALSAPSGIMADQRVLSDGVVGFHGSIFIPAICIPIGQ